MKKVMMFQSQGSNQELRKTQEEEAEEDQQYQDDFINENQCNDLDSNNHHLLVKGLLGNLNAEDQNIFESFQKIGVKFNNSSNPSSQQQLQLKARDHLLQVGYEKKLRNQVFHDYEEQKGDHRRNLLLDSSLIEQSDSYLLNNNGLSHDKKGLIFNCESGDVNIDEESYQKSLQLLEQNKQNLEQTFRKSIAEQNIIMKEQQPISATGTQQNYGKLQNELDDIKKTLDQLEVNNKFLTVKQRNVQSAKRTTSQMPFSTNATDNSLRSQNVIPQQHQQLLEQPQQLQDQFKRIESQQQDGRQNDYVSRAQTAKSRSTVRIGTMTKKGSFLKNETSSNMSLIKNLKKALSKKGGIPYLQSLLTNQTFSKTQRPHSSIPGRRAADNSSFIQANNDRESTKIMQKIKLGIQPYIHAQEGIGLLTSPNNQMQYKGGFKDGKKHGYGELIQILDATKKALIKGKWKNGFLNGKATIVLTYHSREQNNTGGMNNDVFEGVFQKGNAIGFGVLKFANGDLYQGFFKSSMKNGNGKYVSVTDQQKQFRVSAEFKSNLIEGQGAIQYLNGHSYQGCIMQNVISGLGIILFSNGVRIEGQFAQNKTQGRGTLIIPLSITKTTKQVPQITLSSFPVSPNSAQAPPQVVITQNLNAFVSNEYIYVGEFKNGVFAGKGQFKWPQQDELKNDFVYEGSWSNGQIDGKGTFYYGKNIIHGFFKQGLIQGQIYKKQNFEGQKNIIYKGSVMNGSVKMDGFGEIIWTNELQNQQYIGEVKNDVIDGQGQLSFIDQYQGMAQYFGQFKQNLFHGKGELQYSNGDKYVGSFRQGLSDGEGQLVYGVSSIIYTGLFMKGLFHGKGQLKISNQYILDGNFENGLIDLSQNVHLKFTNGDEYFGKVDDQYQKNGACVYIAASDNDYRLIGTFKNGLPNGFCKKIINLKGDQIQHQKLIYGYYNQGRLHGKVIEIQIDSNTGNTLSKTFQLYFNGKLQKVSDAASTIEENQLRNDAFFDAIEKLYKESPLKS